MSLIHRSLRTFQVYGAGTDVGKTVITTLLLRLAADKKRPPLYIKPLSTGPADQSDELHIRKYALKDAPDRAKVLFRLDDPVSPHLAAHRALKRGEEPPTDYDVLSALTDTLHEAAATASAERAVTTALVETAGGVLSPMLSGRPQADAYRIMRLPAILVCDPRLGGISSTISAYESLVLRGYDVLALLMLRDPTYMNHEYFFHHFEKKVGLIAAVPTPIPQRTDDAAADEAAMEAWYEQTVQDKAWSRIIDDLGVLHMLRLRGLRRMPGAAREMLWWPFVQHSTVTQDSDVTTVESAYNDFMSVYSKTSGQVVVPTFDASASWWTQALGHAQDPDITLAVAAAAGKYGHVLFPKVAHEPAVELAAILLATVGEGWAKRVFFSDNGSTGMEVALKMAMRVAASSILEGGNATDSPSNWGVIGLKGSYHGDTIGAMNATQRGPFSCEWHEEKGFWFDAPTVAYVEGSPVIRTADGSILQKFEVLAEAYDVAKRLDSDLAEGYRTFITSALHERARAGQMFGAVVLEPLILGAGGMKFVDPLFQRILVDTARAMSAVLLPQPSREGASIPVVYDEVFSGMGRIGIESNANSVHGIGAAPDISVYSKMLTGGLLPLAATLATEEVFNAFLGEKKDALNHGHSYTATPMACAAALASLEKMSDLLAYPRGPIHMARKMWASQDGGDSVYSVWHPGFVKTLSQCENVEDAMALGTVLSIRLKPGDGAAGYTSEVADQFFQPLREEDTEKGFAIHLRTLGNAAYFMSSLNSKPAGLRTLEDAILQLWGKKHDADVREKWSDTDEYDEEPESEEEEDGPLPEATPRRRVRMVKKRLAYIKR
ncbi:PLP-dependent transferase [Exidia glandulosa HHB12029]|uniref:PLP-dependent transferase n=1 Tax=Exidia glandulosa HHB12029 TaxID=1314781 RepID=A0A165ZPI0_EXIGL|nr:PLP-dependent transferase [Exidia glandulosa HHB12029]